MQCASCQNPLPPGVTTGPRCGAPTPYHASPPASSSGAPQYPYPDYSFTEAPPASAGPQGQGTPQQNLPSAGASERVPSPGYGPAYQSPYPANPRHPTRNFRRDSGHNNSPPNKRHRHSNSNNHSSLSRVSSHRS